MASQNQDGNIRDSAWRILAEEGRAAAQACGGSPERDCTGEREEQVSERLKRAAVRARVLLDRRWAAGMTFRSR